MAVVWFILGDEDEIRFPAQLCEMRDAWLRFLMRDGKDGIEDDRWANQPGID